MTRLSRDARLWLASLIPTWFPAPGGAAAEIADVKRWPYLRARAARDEALGWLDASLAANPLSDPVSPARLPGDAQGCP